MYFVATGSLFTLGIFILVIALVMVILMIFLLGNTPK